MTTIFKYSLTSGSNELILPEGSKVLTVQVQRGSPVLWALVADPGKDELHTINLYPTGQPIPLDPGDYLGTLQMNEGAFVLHAFMAPKSAA